VELEVYYINKDYRPPVHQSSSKRPWMDAAGDKHPYKCIPVVRANSHGWEMRLPQDIVVSWNGGDGSDAITFDDSRYEYETGQPLVDQSLGSGVVSFHIHALIKTPKPYNLYVTGAPNSLVKGAVPLTGVVETWWSPYTFTMNWKIRYVDRPVVFPKGLPFVHFFPINSLELEQWQPVYKNIDEHEHADAHEEWAEDRLKNPMKRHDYYKHGIKPDGCPITDPELHKLKLNLND